MNSKKKSGDLVVPNEPGGKCPLDKPECLEYGCYFYHNLEDWQGCNLRLVEMVMKDLLVDVARCLDDMMGLSRRGKPR